MKLTTLDQVQQCVGRLPAPRDLKVIDHIDEHAARWLSYSRFGFLALGDAGGVQLTAAGGECGFVSTPSSTCIRIPLSSLDDPGPVVPGLSFGGLFLVGGMDESLRVNGTVSDIADGQASVAVQECYLHCAKAFRRSDFWQPEATDTSRIDTAECLQRVRFLALATINCHGHADVSPKGDPEALLQSEGNLICFADRPGNRRIDSFRNILEQPAVSVLALIPGHNEILEITGHAELCTDRKLMQQFAIQGKVPKLITKISPATLLSRASKALVDAAQWPRQHAPKDLIPADIFKAHIKYSKDSSLQAKVARAAIAMPGAMQKGLDHDYKHNLY